MIGWFPYRIAHGVEVAAWRSNIVDIAAAPAGISKG
jgi:hypothetical protein